MARGAEKPRGVGCGTRAKRYRQPNSIEGDVLTQQQKLDFDYALEIAGIDESTGMGSWFTVDELSARIAKDGFVDVPTRWNTMHKRLRRLAANLDAMGHEVYLQRQQGMGYRLWLRKAWTKSEVARKAGEDDGSRT